MRRNNEDIDLGNGRKKVKKSYQAYEMNMSPAARRKQIKGKRRGEEYMTKEFRIDMSDAEILEAWNSFGDDEWTQSLRTQVEHDQERWYHTEHNAKRLIHMEEDSEYGKGRSGVHVERRVNQYKGETPAANRRRQRIQKNSRGAVDLQNKSRKQVKKDVVGMLLNNIQIILTVVFLAALLLVNLLPWTWVTIIAVVLLGIAMWNRASQSKRFRHRGFGKFCSVCISSGLVVGAYYCVMILSLLISISGKNESALKLNRDVYSVYISGIDVYGEVEQSSRSDVNLISTVNPKTGQVLLTTTPRDYYVEIPGVTNGEKDKLTHAGNYGIETSMDTLERIYDEPIDFFIRVNFTSFIDIVNTLGGVTVYSDIAFTTSDEAGGGIVIQEGENHLTGEEALAFSRERYNLPDGDVQRGKNQQRMLEAIIREIMSPMTVFKLSDLLECIAGEVETNMTTSQLQQCSRGVLGNALTMNLYSVAAEGYQDRAMCYSYPDKSLYVTIPDQGSVDQIMGYMDTVAIGENLPEE